MKAARPHLSIVRGPHDEYPRSMGYVWECRQGFIACYGTSVREAFDAFWRRIAFV